MIDLKQLEHEAVQEEKRVEEEALKLFIKDFIKQDLTDVKTAKRKLDNMVKRKDMRTIDFYKREFEVMSPMHGCSNKEYYKNKV